MSLSYGKTVTYGTMFSGSDVLHPCLQQLSRYWLNNFGQDIHFKQMFLIERDEWKRELCDLHWHCEHQLADALALEAESWIGYDYKTRRTMAVPKVDLHAAGFECDSLSSCNMNRAEHGDCVERGEDKTGQTAQATLSHRPRLSWWENVKFLRGKNLNTLVQWCVAHGFYIIHNLVEALLFGSATRRERQWMLVIDVMGEDVQVSDDALALWDTKRSAFNAC